MQASGASARSCEGSKFGGSCGKLIWVPPGKNYTKCRDCSEREGVEREEQWLTKPCSKGCGNTIKYHKDWDKVPDLCKSCKEAEKAKWREKPCAGGCGNTIKYNVDWDNPPNYCKSCKEKRNERRHESNQSENPRYHAAVGNRGVRLTVEEEHRFKEYFHQQVDRQRMSFDEIVEMASEWLRENGGGFRRSDRR